MRFWPAVLLCAACATTPMRNPTHTPSQALADSASDWWQMLMKRYPTWATYIGDRRYDDRLTDLSPEARQAWLAEVTAMKARVEAIPGDALATGDRVTWDVLQNDLADSLDGEVCRSDEWTIDQLDGIQIGLGELPQFHSVKTAQDTKNLASRWRAAGVNLRQHVANLRRGLADGLTAPRINVERVLSQLDALLATPVEKSAFVDMKLPPEVEGERAALTAAVKDNVYPGLQAYRDFLKNEYVARARTEVGVGALPNGKACYAYLVKSHTGAERPPPELHQLGMQELERLHKEMATVLRQIDGSTDVIAFLKALPKRKDQYLTTREALLELNTKILQRAQAALPKAFGRLPKTPVELKAIEAFREKDAPAAYYYGAPDDGSRPAYYYLNTYEPETRPLYDMEALAFHEAVPGHHLQLAISQELRDLPDFRRHGGQTAFIEGWALYAEGLADELGLYSGPMARMGMLNMEAWRAARLVVDTGMHTMRWTRQQALDFMAANTALVQSDAENEIDRYIIWPGQALAYKVGQLTFRDLRARAQKRMGAKFDLRAFHDAALANGGLPMSVLEREMERWISSQPVTAPVSSR